MRRCSSSASPPSKTRLLPQRLDVYFGQHVQGILAAHGVLDDLADGIEIRQIVLYRVVDLAAQNDVPMALDDILQPHLPDLPDRSGHLVDVPVHDVRQGQEGVSREKDAVFLYEHGDAIRAVAGGADEGQALFAYSQGERPLVEDQVRRHQLDLLESRVLAASRFLGNHAFFQHQLAAE